MIGITRIWDRLLLGGIDDAEALAKSNPFRITTVLSVCAEPVQKRAAGVNYIRIPVADCRRIAVGTFESVMSALAEGIRRGTVLLHCAAGVSRSPIMCAAWMHVVGYKHIDAALAEITRLRQIVEPSPVLLASVKEHLR